MTSVNVFGFELLQKFHDNEIQKKEDVIILFVHWYLTKSGFKCIGIGDENMTEGLEEGSDLLPENWNLHANYTLRYVINGRLFVLIGIKSNVDLLMNFLEYHENTITNIQFPIEKTVSALHGPLKTILPSYEAMLRSIDKDFVSKVYIKTADSTTQTINETKPSEASSTAETTSTRHEGCNSSNCSYNQPSSLRNPAYNPLRVGVRDLDPLGIGGGMIFDPFNNRSSVGRHPGLGVPGMLPPGAIPPGARFDPFGPHDLSQRPLRRDPDNPFFSGDLI
ncbi:proteasome inhibitor PI31 subunit [Linepithema humile]|uniref:proteasome inhibitor PI31 subunit n=1 Tax=Linepithema humile TaxID=83485 RepID=UPI0006232A32|nr:PREDICTED: proteasome inhibitor PI31 subunit [Linepithema humile]